MQYKSLSIFKNICILTLNYWRFKKNKFKIFISNSYSKMNRIRLNRISELSKAKRQQFKPINNWLIDFYLDGFKRRERRKEKSSTVFVKYLTIFCFVVNLTKTLLCFAPLSKTTKLVLFDIAAFIGGIELYNRILVTTAIIMGFILFFIFRIKEGSAHREWTQVFEMTRSRVLHLFLTGNEQNDLLIKLMKAMRVIYKLMNISFFNFGMYP